MIIDIKKERMMKRIVIMSLAAIFCLAGKGFCADPRKKR